MSVDYNGMQETSVPEYSKVKGLCQKTCLHVAEMLVAIGTWFHCDITIHCNIIEGAILCGILCKITSKMPLSKEKRIEQRVVVRFCFLQQNTPTETYLLMKETYRDGMLSKRMYLSGLLPLKMTVTVWPICHHHD